MQISQQQVVGDHQIADLQHDSPELFIILSYRRPLPQVKQVGLVAQGVVQVTELSFQGMTKILPKTYAQLSPILVGCQPPPC